MAAVGTPFSPHPRLTLHAPPHTRSHPMTTKFHTLTTTILRRLTTVAAAQNSPKFTAATLACVKPAAESLYHITVDVSSSSKLAESHTAAGQYLTLRIPPVNLEIESPDLTLAIASPPPKTALCKGEFEFLVNSIAGSTAEKLCNLEKGGVVELSQVMGDGFNIKELSPPESVFIFATGSGISPIRSLIESGFSADMGSEVTLFYGAKNRQRMAYQDKFKEWTDYGVRIVPVFSQPEGCYVQTVFIAEKENYPKPTGAVLCGQNEMVKDVTSILLGMGVPEHKILKNF